VVRLFTLFTILLISLFTTAQTFKGIGGDTRNPSWISLLATKQCRIL